MKSDDVSLTLRRQGFFIAFALFVSTPPNLKFTRFGYESFFLVSLESRKCSANIHPIRMLPFLFHFSAIELSVTHNKQAGPFRMGFIWYESLPAIRPFRFSLAMDSPTRVFHSIFGNRVMLLILQQRYRELRRSQNLNTWSTTSPGFLTTVGFDWEWDTVPRDSIELDERQGGRRAFCVNSQESRR